MNLKEVVLSKIQESNKSITEISKLAKIPTGMLQRFIDDEIELPAILLARLYKTLTQEVND
jgi:predicted HTH domain antitoxin